MTGVRRVCELRRFPENQFEAFRVQLAELEATDEHRRHELNAALAEAGHAQAAVRKAQARLEERGHIIEESRGDAPNPGILAETPASRNGCTSALRRSDTPNMVPAKAAAQTTGDQEER